MAAATESLAASVRPLKRTFRVDAVSNKDDHTSVREWGFVRFVFVEW
jgi:hypothetical protein